MDLEIHNAVKITRSEIYSPSDGEGKKWRTVTITTDKGEEIEITCWAKKFDDLLIKNEDE